MHFSDVWRAGVFLLFLVWFFPSDKAMAVLSLESSFSVSQSYTSNLFFEEENEREDFGTFLGPNFTLLFEDPDIVIGATYFGRVALFINNPDANQYIQRANIILDLPFLTKRFRGLTVTIEENMRFTPELDGFSLSGAEDASTFSGGDPRSGGLSGGSTGSGGTGGASAGGSIGGSDPGGGGVSAPEGPLGGLGTSSGIFTTRASAFRNQAGITLGYLWTPRVHTSLGYSNNYLHFFSSGFQDSVRHIVSSSLSYRVTNRTSVTPSYSYNRYNFIGDSTQTTSGDKIISHNPRLGISHTLTPSLTVSVSGGVAFVKQIGAEENVPGPGNTTVTRELSEKFRTRYIGSASISKTYRQGLVALTFHQTTGSGGGIASQATRTRFVTGRIQHGLSQRMNAFASFGWAENDSIEGNAFDTTTYRIQTGLGYSFSSWLFGNFNYSHIKQSSSGSAATDLNVDQFFLGLSALADPWVIFR